MHIYPCPSTSTNIYSCVQEQLCVVFVNTRTSRPRRIEPDLKPLPYMPIGLRPLTAVLSEYLWMPINGAKYLWIYQCLWISMNIYEHLWISMNMYGYLWVSMNIYEYVWISMNIYKYLGTSMNIYGYVWISMNMHGYSCMCMDIYEYLWTCMSIYEYLRLWIVIDLIDIHRQSDPLALDIQRCS